MEDLRTTLPLVAFSPRLGRVRADSLIEATSGVLVILETPDGKADDATRRNAGQIAVDFHALL